MKKLFFIFTFTLFLFTGCFNDHSNYDYICTDEQFERVIARSEKCLKYFDGYNIQTCFNLNVAHVCDKKGGGRE